MSENFTMGNIVIEGRSLIKKFGSQFAVNRLDLEVLQGECFGVLGPKDSGKTTLLRMIYCSSRPTSGDIFVFGLDAKTRSQDIKSRLGVVPQDDGWDPDFCIYDHLLSFSKFYNIPTKQAKLKIKELLETLQLYDVASACINTLSDVQKKRLTMARSLLHNPGLLIFDEPTVGLKTQDRRSIWDQLIELKQQGKTSVLATCSAEEAERLCDRLIIIDQGEVLDLGCPEELIRRHIGKDIVEFTCNEIDLNYHLTRLGAQYAYHVSEGRLILFVRENQDIHELINRITSDNLVIRRPTLNDVYIKLSGYDLGD